MIADRYEVLREHGGGQGRVLEAVDRRHSRTVALKVRAPSDEALAEAQVLLRLPPHPSLPVAREDFYWEGEYLLVTDWVAGENVKGRVLPLADATGLRTLDVACPARAAVRARVGETSLVGEPMSIEDVLHVLEDV